MLLEDAIKLSGKEKLCGIYSITNTANNKIYIGQSKDIYKRAARHVKYKTNVHLNASIKKYCINNFVHNIELLCKEELLSYNEKYVFSNYKNKGYAFYNIAECGYGGNTLMFATKDKAKEVNARRGEMLVSINASKSKEEKYIINSTIAATYTTKYNSTIQNVIATALEHKLFTFSKYKQHCIYNNISIVVSYAYFDRIIKFAKNKEQLKEFVAIYKEGMDYNTYKLLCKCKAVTKEVYAVTVKYSTYKYFI